MSEMVELDADEMAAAMVVDLMAADGYLFANRKQAEAVALAGVKQSRTGWQPIGTAPRDGSYFITAKFPSDDGEYEITSYAPYNWKSYVETEPGSGLFKEVLSPMGEWTGSNMHRATHWCALPATPATSA